MNLLILQPPPFHSAIYAFAMAFVDDFRWISYFAAFFSRQLSFATPDTATIAGWLLPPAFTVS